MLDLVELAAFSATKGRWVKKDGIVAAAAFNLAGKELIDVVHNPADRVAFKSVQFGVLSCPCDHTFGGVNVTAMSAALCCGKGGTTRVGEEVEEVEWLTTLSAFLFEGVTYPFPHGTGLRKDA